MVGWLPSDLDATGEQHAFRLDMGAELGSGYIMNCDSGFMALCGKVASKLENYPETEEGVRHYFATTLKCETCETLLGERGRPL